MIKLFLFSIFLFLMNYPLAFMRKNLITENPFYGVFLGNYIFFSHYLVIILFILTIIHYLIFKIPTKIRNSIIIISLIIVGVVSYMNYRYSKVIYSEITLNKKADIDKLKIAFVADLHLTKTSNKNLFIEMTEKINKENPDIIIFGGDILQDSHTNVTEDYSDVFSKLKAKYGVYTIIGNHEYYGYDIHDNVIYLENHGINILRDEVLNIEGINLVARDDIRRNDYIGDQRKPLDELYLENNISFEEPIIILDHNPQSINESIENNADVQLSGHTHAGQFFPYNLLLRLRVLNPVGYKKIENLHTITTAGVGVGYWKIIGPWVMPYRFGTNSEINIIEINFNN